VKGSVIDLGYFKPYHDSKEVIRSINNIDFNGAKYNVAMLIWPYN
jgi:hypothetical protein